MTATMTQTLAEHFTAEFAGSKRRFERARTIFPDGVTHDSRRLEPFPVYFERAAGSRKWDVDGHELIDFWNGHGALLLGHSPPAVVEAVREQAALGTHFGGCHDFEIEWGELVKRLVPSAERVRFTSSGTEATLMALRLARLFTGRAKVLKFVGHFHGWHDAVMPGAYPPYDTNTVPGLPPEVREQTVVIPPNDSKLLETALSSDLQIGAVILEPTGGHWGEVPIRGDFLRQVRALTERHGQLLIFDEVITGFRVHPGGAQAHYVVRPDLTTLAKILAGGLPGGALAGRADILAGLEVRPGKPKMRHPGTYNANPLSAAAGVAALKQVATGEPCRKANDAGRLLKQKLNALFDERFPDWVAYGDFSLIHVKPGYEGPRPGGDDFVPYSGALNKLDGPKNMKLLTAWRHGLLLNGVDWFGFGAFTTAAHTADDIELTVNAVANTIEALRAEGLC
ncbi:MAG: aspartate aminotransferase family protein [Gemmataceae bacterium]